MSSPTTAVLPPASGLSFVTDGGLETDLIYLRGVDLPEFAAFPLLDSESGSALLRAYFEDYVAIARDSGRALLLETPTWRASPDWGSLLGYSADELARVNAASVELLGALRERHREALHAVLVSGSIGPRYDGYSADARVEPEVAADYHAGQLAAFATAGADLATAYTLTHVGEAIGIVRAARAVGLPIAISFTVETDGRLPSGSTLAAAIEDVDAAAPPDYYLVNCAHPSHIERALTEPGGWTERIAGTRGNASLASHAELDAATELDDGDPDEFAAAQVRLAERLPQLSIVGGCCGTDARHVARLWGTD
jgi:S-methylmethionine-dependent homocysteine/selenocysteine methylase